MELDLSLRIRSISCTEQLLRHIRTTFGSAISRSPPRASTTWGLTWNTELLLRLVAGGRTVGPQATRAVTTWYSHAREGLTKE